MTSLGGLSGGSDFSSSKKKTQQQQQTDKESKYFVRKYSTGIALAEQIMIGGRSMFLQKIDGRPRVTPLIDLTKQKGMTLIPNQTVGSASPIIEYEYNDLSEIEYFIDRASRMKVDDLYFLVKSIFKDVIATNEKELIILLATDTIMSFFQDLFVTTHYLVLTGPPGWGKGAILVAFKILGYRVVLAGDMSGANLLDLLGPIEKCQVTLAEDEFDKIQDDPDKERIYKMGYEDVGAVTRTVDPSSRNRRLLYYNPYCLKFFASEEGPDPKQLGGFNDRLFRAEVKKGRPRLLIKEIKKQMERPLDKQLPKYRVIVSRINFLRKLSLVFRLLHHEDTIEEVPLNIYDRPLELCGPAIRLFNSETLADPDRKALKEIMSALSHFLQKKGQLDKKMIELVIYDVLKNLFEQMDVEEKAPGTSTILNEGSCKKETTDDVYGNKSASYVIAYDELCNRIMKEVEGTQISPRTFECPDYGKVTHDSLLAKCRNVFDGKLARLTTGTKNRTARSIAFDRDTVTKAGQTFDVVSEIKILAEDQQEKSAPEDYEDRSRWDEWTNGHAKQGGGNSGSGTGSGACPNVQISSQYGGKDTHQDHEDSGIKDSQKVGTNDQRTAKPEENNDDKSNISLKEGGSRCPNIPLRLPRVEKIVHKDMRAAPWISENRGWTHEEAEAFKAEIAGLGKNRSKVAEMATTNLSGNGVMFENKRA